MNMITVDEIVSLSQEQQKVIEKLNAELTQVRRELDDAQCDYRSSEMRAENALKNMAEIRTKYDSLRLTMERYELVIDALARTINEA